MFLMVDQRSHVIRALHSPLILIVLHNLSPNQTTLRSCDVNERTYELIYYRFECTNIGEVFTVHVLLHCFLLTLLLWFMEPDTSGKHSHFESYIRSSVEFSNPFQINWFLSVVVGIRISIASVPSYFPTHISHSPPLSPGSITFHRL